MYLVFSVGIRRLGICGLPVSCGPEGKWELHISKKKTVVMLKIFLLEPWSRWSTVSSTVKYILSVVKFTLGANLCRSTHTNFLLSVICNSGTSRDSRRSPRRFILFRASRWPRCRPIVELYPIKPCYSSQSVNKLLYSLWKLEWSRCP